jgi:hypothetical protein
LADALVRKDLADSPANTFAASPPLPRVALTSDPFRPPPGKRASARELEELADSRRQAFFDADMAVIGECVARTAPQYSHALLMTEVGSPEESARFALLLRAFGECMPTGRTADLEARGPIALSYYRLAKSGAAQ